jgi:primosomal protein N' (replication factor Y) (superfamily II helicase)
MVLILAKVRCFGKVWYAKNMADKKTKFILDIVPLTKIPLTRNQAFCYISDEILPAGTLVSIPLFRRNVEGIVVKSRLDFKRFGNIELKKIDKIIEKEFLTAPQLELAQFVSDYYISPLGVAIKNFVPKRVKARGIKHETYSIKQKNIVLTREQTDAVNKIIKSNFKFQISNFKFLLLGPSSSGKTEVYIHSMLKLREKDQNLQFLILVPEKTLTPQAVERYDAHFKPEEIAILSSNIPKGQLYSSWQKIKSGEAKIIIGTRMAVFAPFKKLGLIVIDEEQDISYKQWDMNPRYDARKVSEKLAEFHKCPVVFGTATPSIETYYKTINNDYGLLKLPVLKIPSTKYQIPNTIIVDMRLERLNKNTSCISKKLKSEIAYALKNKLQTILFINRQGMSSFSVCDSCKTVLKCPRCDRALVYDKGGNYRCVHCSYKTSIMPTCSKCKGIIFKNIGLGTQKVEREIINLFPGARVARIDSQIIKSTKYQENIYKDFSEGKIDILIGTQMISKGWDLPNVSLVGIIDADNMLTIPDFSGSSHFFQNIVQVSGRVSRPGAKYPGVVVLQTYQPENRLIKLASERSWDKFFELEIAERKSLSLPPFAKLIKLVFQDYSFKKTDAEAHRVYDLLKNIKNASISEPQDAYVSKIRGRFRKQIIIKYKKEISPQLRKILNSLGQGWIIDVEPISII